MIRRDQRRKAIILTGISAFLAFVVLITIPLGNKPASVYDTEATVEQADHPSNVFSSIMVPEYKGPKEKQFIFEGICGEQIDVALEGPVFPEKRTIVSTTFMTREIKQRALALGADIVMVGRMNPRWIFKGAALSHTYAVVIGERLPYEYTVSSSFQVQTARAVSEFYKSGGQIALLLAEEIRRMGYPSRAHYESWSQVLTIPVAIDAGMGELGRNGLLIVPEFGPAGRFSIVTTDLPLEPDKPRFLGVQEFCQLCTKCVRYCPANAVPLGGPTVVRGVRKWEVDLRKCLDYWYKDPANSLNCLGCITSCPFNKPDSWLHRIGRYLVQRNCIARYVLMYLDDILGYGYEYDPMKIAQQARSGS